MIAEGLTWDHPRGYVALAAAAEKAAAEGRPVVAWSKQPLEGFESHPIAELAARYDLLVLDHPHIGEAVDADCLVPLETLFTAEDIAGWREQTVGPALRSYEWDGKHYALPLDVATQVMAYRPDLVADAPKTFDEVVRLAEKARVAVSVSGPHAICSFFSVCISLGEEPGGDGLVSDAVAGEALSILGRLSKTAPRGTETLNPIRLLETMATGDAIALVPLIYGYVNYARPAPGRHRVAFADAPVARRGGRHGSVLGGTGIAVTKRARPDAALLDHLRWLMSKDTQTGFIPEHEGQPSARAAWRSDKVNRAAGDFYRDTLATVEEAWVRPRHNHYIAFQTAGSAILRETILGGAPVPTTLGKLRDAWARSLHALSSPASAGA
jgi:multiple sugar transport system substrate-binding protein